MTEWKQERPSWCPHPDCRFLRRSQDVICSGHMSSPRLHEGVENTHRLCQRADDGAWLHTVELNKGDAYNLYRILKGVFGFGAGTISAAATK
jgi:hypothetical protein